MPNSGASRPIPMLGDISLEKVQRIEHEVKGGFVPLQIPGLAGQVMQRTERHSHRIRIRGVLFGETAATDLETLQTAASEGQEVTFSASIVTALDLQRVVIDSFRASEEAGKSNFYEYELLIAESPPLPPPAQVSGFGGLDDFGLGDLGFDTDILGDLLDQAGAIASAIDDAMQLVDQLGALTGIRDLTTGGLIAPLERVAGNVGDLGAQLGDALNSLLSGFK